MPGRVKFPKFSEELIEIGSTQLQRKLNLTAQRADEVMQAIAERVSWRMGRSVVYIPETARMILAKRDAEIYGQYTAEAAAERPGQPFSGERIQWLSDRYDLTSQMIYRIIKRARASAEAPPGSGRQVAALPPCVHRVVPAEQPAELG